MDKAKEDRDYAKSIIDEEGIGYAVTCYCGSNAFEYDDKLRMLWSNARKALEDLAEYVGSKCQ